MKFPQILLLLVFVGVINETNSVCVLESDFGFALNCNFKKAGLFRVRNLGGLKAHFGLGFSLGDELGFPESLGNVDAVKKRSLDVRTSAPQQYPDMKVEQHFQQQTHHQQLAQPREYISQPRHMMRTSMPIQSPLVVSTPQGFRKRPQQMMTEAQSLPLGVPPFRKLTSPTISSRKGSVYSNEKVPEFQALPSSISAQQLVQPTKVEFYPKDQQKMPEVDLKGHTVQELAAIAGVSEEYIRMAIKIRQQQMLKEKMQMKVNSTVSKTTPLAIETTDKVFVTPTIKSFTATESTTSAAASFSSKKKDSSPKPYVPKKKSVAKKVFNKLGQKVMNAPKEYYPVGYDKNFDDNFKSKIDLPATSFNCGDQRHFPGLYGDEDLGCMVFHVCALTDDGLVMKSFLCPESTLFDQSILKCNWWFYTDCKNSKSLYDSNLPVSKSYQLMKSLSYFNNNYKAPPPQQQNPTVIDQNSSQNDIHHDEQQQQHENEHDFDEKVSIISAHDEQH